MSLVRPRLILLTQWFDPEPTFKGIVFASALKARGFDVEVVTGFPNYPGGELYEGYKMHVIHREIMNDVQVTRLPLYPSHDHGVVGRALNYLSFCLSCTIYMIFCAKRADIVYAYHPPLTVSFAAIFAKLIRRTPTVIDLQDMWPDTLRATGMLSNGLLLGFIGRVCKWVYRKATHIVVLSPGFRDLLVDRGVPEKKISVIYNWADEVSIAQDFEAIPTVMDGPKRFRVLFAGNIGRAQALDSVIDAAAILEKKLPSVDFCFLGDGLDAERIKEKAKYLSNVKFFPKVGMHEVGNYLRNCDCLLVHLRSDPLFHITIPSKTQAYMTAGRPIIMAVEGDAAALITKAGCGLAIPSENANELSIAVCHLASLDPNMLAEMGRAGRQYYADQLSVQKGSDAFAQLFRYFSRS